MVNWAKLLTELAAKRDGDFGHPDVIRLGHQLWNNSNAGRFILDGKRYTNITIVAATLHINYGTLIGMMAEAGFGDNTEASGTLRISGHTLVFDKKAESYKGNGKLAN